MPASVSSIQVSASTYNTSYISINLDGGSTILNLTEDERQQLLAIGLQIFFARQADIAAQIAAIPNPLLAPPPAPAASSQIVDGEWTPAADGDTPFQQVGTP